MRWLLWSILAVLVWPVLVKADSQQQTYNNFQALPADANQFMDIGQATIGINLPVSGIASALSKPK
jgi:hypothetical protein